MTVRTADCIWAEFINGIGLDSHLYYIHVLRHSCGTNLAIKGWELVDIAKYLGHSNINMTLGTFTWQECTFSTLQQF